MITLCYTHGWTVSNTDEFYHKEKGILGLIGCESTTDGDFIVVSDTLINDPSKNLHYKIHQDSITVKIHFLGLLEYCKTILYAQAVLAEMKNQSDEELTLIKPYDYKAIIESEFVILTFSFTQNQFFIENRVDYYHETYQVLKISKDIANYLALRLIRECTKYPLLKRAELDKQCIPIE